jgi:glycosyltransferase involved in cell wall biosynthesis
MSSGFSGLRAGNILFFSLIFQQSPSTHPMNQTPASSQPPLPRMAFISGLGFGGSTTFLCHLTTELTRRGVPVLVVSPESENAFASDFRAGGVKVILQKGRLIFEDRLHSMMLTLAQFRPTVVVGCMGADSYEVLRYVPKGVRRLAVIQTDHPIHYDPAVHYAGCLDAIVGISTKITERLEKMEVFRDVTKRCLLHGVAMPATIEPRGNGSECLRILYLGRITNGQKRVYLFPQILADLKKSGIPFRWTIVGDGDQRTHLEPLMASDEPGQEVLFTGSLPNAQIPALLEQHDVFLLASDAEGLPISLLEAMAHGLVPVVSDIESGIRDVVDDGNGCLVPVDDTAGYARALVHLHRNRGELAAKSAAAHARVREHFSVSAMADRWLAEIPSPPPAIEPWPKHFKIKAPLTTGKNPVHFSTPMRVLRRMAARLRK